MVCPLHVSRFFLHGKAPDDVRVIVPNAGDSRAVLVRAGTATSTLFWTISHAFHSFSTPHAPCNTL